MAPKRPMWKTTPTTRKQPRPHENIPDHAKDNPDHMKDNKDHTMTTLPSEATPRAPVDPDDPKGLIREAYRIDGIGAPECRSILVDWALTLPAGRDARDALKALHDRYANSDADHPMSALLLEGQQPVPVAGRRGGSRGRRH